MSISDTQKVDYLWKKIGYGRAKTDVSSVKDATNESTSSPLLLRGDEIWAQSSLIPSSIPGSSSTIVTVYPTSSPVECTADITASTNRTWKTGTIDWIPPEIGSTYLIKVYLHTASDAGNAATSGTQVYAAGSGNNDEFFFDYKSGILNFIGTNLPSGISGKKVYISGARYIGVKGTSIPGSGGSFSSLNVTGVVTASSFAGDGSALTGIDATSLKDSEGNIKVQANPSGVVVSGVTTATTFFGDGSNLTGITASGTGAIGGLTIKNQSGAVVGTAGSVSTLDFNGSSNVTVTATSGSSGIATIIISDLLDGQAGSYYTGYTDTAIANLVDSAPGTLNTLNELATALGDDASFSTTVTNSIATKLPLAGGTMTGSITFSSSQTFDGRDLSADGSKLDGIASGATNVTNNNQLTNGASYITNSGGTEAATASTVVKRSSAADIFCRLVRPNYQNQSTISGAIAYRVESGSNNYIRFCNDKAAIRTFLNVPNTTTVITNNNQLTNGANYITSFDITTQTDGKYLRSNAADTASERITFTANSTNSWDTIATSSGSQGGLEIYNSGSGTDAFMTFHVGGDYACYFGLDGGTNKLSVGGWSMGANSYEIYHSGNKPSLATLGFTGATNANYITNNNQLTNGAGYYASGSSPTFANAYTNGWWRNNDAGEGLYNQNTTKHFYSASTSYWHIDSGAGLIFYDQYNSSAGGSTGRKGYVYFDSSGFGLLSNDGSWAYRHNNTYADIYGTIRRDATHTLWDSGNDGSGSGLDADTVDGVQAANLLGSHQTSNLTITNKGYYTTATSSQNQNSGVISYGWGYQIDGAWSNPFPDIVFGYHTGMRFGGYYGYGGCRFYNDHPSRSTTELFSVGNGDNHVRVSNNLYIQGNTAWHSGNDGSGSGLDADTLDGNQASSFITTSGTQGSNLYIRNGSPTIYFRDTDQNSAMLHNNSDLFYILRGGDDTSTWSQIGSQWPAYWNLTNNDVTMGRNISAIGNVTAYASDIRLKENFKHIESPLEKLQKLNGYTFDWNGKNKEIGFTPEQEKNDIGLIAQEVQEIMPQAVKPAPFDIKWDSDKKENISKSGENYLTVQYERLVPLLVEAIKEQQEQINTLKEEIKSIKK